MKKQMIISIIAAVMMLVGVDNSNAEMRDHKSKPVDVEDGIPMMPPIRHDDMGFMEGMHGAEYLIWKQIMNLGLDEKQGEAIKEIRSRVMKDMIRSRAEAHVAEIELKDLLDKDTTDMKAVEAKLKQIGKLKHETLLSLISAIEEAKSKLTPEQKKKFKEVREAAHDVGFPMTGRIM